MSKIELRDKIKKIRNDMTFFEVQEKSKKICDNFLTSELYENAKIIAVYMSIKNEVDLSRVIEKAFSDGKRVLVPVTDKLKKEIYLSELLPDSRLLKGNFNIPEPDEKKEMNTCDIMLVPGLAFSKEGDRIGWGGGFYDRLISKVDTVTVGVCYDFQLVRKIEKEAHDFSMNYLVTESEMMACE